MKIDACAAAPLGEVGNIKRDQDGSLVGGFFEWLHDGLAGCAL